MIIWRVSRFGDLSGQGGLHVSGRWHTVGTRILYTAESVALALLETLVQVEDRLELPPRYQLLKIQVPDAAAQEERPDVIPSLQESRLWGNKWLAERRSLLAKVPAVVAPYSWNWLLNPAHPDARQVSIVEAADWEWDARLFG